MSTWTAVLCTGRHEQAWRGRRGRPPGPRVCRPTTNNHRSPSSSHVGERHWGTGHRARSHPDGRRHALRGHQGPDVGAPGRHPSTIRDTYVRSEGSVLDFTPLPAREVRVQCLPPLHRQTADVWCWYPSFCAHREPRHHPGLERTRLYGGHPRARAPRERCRHPLRGPAPDGGCGSGTGSRTSRFGLRRCMPSAARWVPPSGFCSTRDSPPGALLDPSIPAVLVSPWVGTDRDLAHASPIEAGPPIRSSHPPRQCGPRFPLASRATPRCRPGHPAPAACRPAHPARGISSP